MQDLAFDTDDTRRDFDVLVRDVEDCDWSIVFGRVFGRPFKNQRVPTAGETESRDSPQAVQGVGFATRQVGNRTKPNLVVSVDDQGTVCMKSQSTFKNTEIKFKLNEPFEETTADDRKTRTVVTLDNGKLVQKQNWDGKETCIEREISDGKLIAKCIIGDVVAVRTYVKEA
ncbi:hypothetical protein fugu_018361 [Takifugu bimaculatus]|uniref:Cellular retinoic acid-binding protein 1 n=1 Tax=Takifugu bimaculatus TaxID=433685 RepID=A0A4Z2BLR2_9TELE|nr:hypothetical protein fugu_018361 [Takifugu bimaculatus]